MTNERLKKLATQLIGFFKNVEHQNDILSVLKSVAKKQQIYFSNFTPQEFLKFYFFILSLKKTGKFDWSDEILEKIFFAYLFTPSGYDYSEECNDCDGSGRVDCRYCDGSGNEECQECDGDGVIECGECEGKGKVVVDDEVEDCESCDGTGEVKCQNCDGGNVNCDYCDGDARQECGECNGEGELMGSDFAVELLFVCSWDINFRNLCELNLGTPKPVATKDGIETNDKIITLSFRDWGDLDVEYIDEVEEGEVYCWGFTDETSVSLSRAFEIRSH